jgi:competence protein ComEA
LARQEGRRLRSRSRSAELRSLCPRLDERDCTTKSPAIQGLRHPSPRQSKVGLGVPAQDGTESNVPQEQTGNASSPRAWQRFRGLLLFVPILAAVVAIVAISWRRPRSQAEPLIIATASPSTQATATQHPVRVYVSGAVEHPDVYTLPPGSIVKDAIVAAGGAAADADLDAVNLALPLSDALQVHVPRQGEASHPRPLQGSPSPGGSQVDLNTAGAAELETLPGIGPALAQRIVDYRQTHGPFQTIEDIMQVSGIGPATFDKIKALIRTN